MKQKEFMKNAVIMTITAFLLRGIGIVFRIYLSNQIGAEGMGLYQLVFSVYVLGSTFASAGICTAVARLVTDELISGTIQSVRKIMRRATFLSVIIGVFSAVMITTCSSWMGQHLINDVRAIPSLQILGLCLPFMGVSSCIRGYFLARRKTLLPSLAQIAEQCIRIILIAVLLHYMKPMGVAFSCFAIICGDCLAEIISCGIIIVGYIVDQRKLSVTISGCATITKKGAIRSILAIATPITAGRYLNSALRTIENILVPNKLAAYSGSDKSGLSQFGTLKGMALPLLFFPASFLSSVSTLLIPELSEANTLQQKVKVSKAVSRTLQITLLSSILLSGLFTVFAFELGDVLYNSEEVGFLLRVLSPLMPIMYLESIVDGMLKGLNQQAHSLWYSVLDSGSRIILILFIVPRKGMGGFLFIMVISNLLTSYLNTHRLLEVSGVCMQWKNWIIKPTVAIALASFITQYLFHSFPSSLQTGIPFIILGSCCISTIYLLCAFCFGILNIKDLRSFQLRRSEKTMMLPNHF